jgi:hypothetical protein
VSTLFLLTVFLILLTAYLNNTKKVAIEDDSKVLATVDGKNITQQMVDMVKINSGFSEKQILAKLIDDELLISKAKELKISVSDKEAKSEAQKQKKIIEDMLIKANNSEEIKNTIDNFIKKLGITQSKYWNSYAVQGYKNALTIAKTKEKLGAGLEKTLKELRAKANISYND